jgi:hypothetical protein
MADANSIREAFDQVARIQSAIEGLQYLIEDDRVSSLISVISDLMTVRLSALDVAIQSGEVTH